MMVVTKKINIKRLVIIAAAVVAAIVLLLVGGGKKTEAPQTAGVGSKVESNADRIAYLNGFGWEVKETPVQTQEVKIPEQTDEITDRYNELQKSQGFDLEKFAGKCVKRYVYEITNYPGSDETYHATLLIYNGEVVGGDVASQAKGGTMHGFMMPGGDVAPMHAA